MLARTAVGAGPARGQLGGRGQFRGRGAGGQPPLRSQQPAQLVVGQPAQAVAPGPVGKQCQQLTGLHLVQHAARGEPKTRAAITVGEPGGQHLGHRRGRPGVK